MVAYLIVALATIVSVAVGQATLTTPAMLVQCQPALLTVAGGTGPYYISVIPAGQASLAASG